MKESVQLFLRRELVDLVGPVLPKLLTLNSPNNSQTNFSSKSLHVPLKMSIFKRKPVQEQ